jgi:hypothetical protein
VAERPVDEPEARIAARPGPAVEEPAPVARASRLADAPAPAARGSRLADAPAPAARAARLAEPPAPTARPAFRGRDAELEIEVLLRSTAERRAVARPSPPLPPAASAPARVVAGPRTTIGQRVAVLLALLLLTLAVVALATSGGPSVAMSRADASFLSAELVRADQLVSTQLVRVREGATSNALARTRDAVLTTRSLGVEMRAFRGPQADRLRRALRHEGRWLDAVGSTLSNPRSPLRAELLTRAVAARRALAALPGARPRITSGATQLVAYARRREQAARVRARP